MHADLWNLRWNGTVITSIKIEKQRVISVNLGIESSLQEQGPNELVLREQISQRSIIRRLNIIIFKLEYLQKPNE